MDEHNAAGMHSADRPELDRKTLLISKLLHSVNEDNEYLNQLVRDAGIVFQGHCWAVMVASLLPTEADTDAGEGQCHDFPTVFRQTPYPQHPLPRDTRRPDRMAQAALPFLTGLIAPLFPCYGVGESTQAVLVVDFCCLTLPQAANGIRRLIRHLKKELPARLETLRRESGLRLQLHVGSPCDRLCDWELSYHHALRLSVYAHGNGLSVPVYDYFTHDKCQLPLTAINTCVSCTVNALAARDFRQAESCLLSGIRLQLGFSIYNHASLRMFLFQVFSAALPRIANPSLTLPQINAFLFLLEQEVKVYFSSIHQGCGTPETISTLVKRLLSHVNIGQNALGRGAMIHAAQVQSFLNDSFAQPDLSLGQLVDRLGISLSQLSREFHRITGQRMIDYLHRLRIDAANQLLTSTQLSVEQISQRVGYASASTFIRAYKRYAGLTPREFRLQRQASRSGASSAPPDG